MKSNIPMPAAIAAAVVVLLVVLFFGWRALNTEPTPTGIGANGAKVNTTGQAGGSGGQAVTPGKTVGGMTSANN